MRKLQLLNVQASRQITYVSYYTMLTNDSRSKTLIRVTINFTYLTFYIHMGTRNHFFIYKQYFIKVKNWQLRQKPKGLTGAILTLHIYKKRANKTSTNFGQTHN